MNLNECLAKLKPRSTPNGYDQLWIAAINGVLEDRESTVRIVDLDGSLWEEFLGPLVDAFEDGNVDPRLVVPK